MKLKRLIIQGFKSFKDRTVINFDDGITGIVGPNGCGKSNIVDALFWVMGEQSAKHLRGNTMKDVIFSGSSRYSPGAFAEATLVLENSDGKHIHIGNKVCSPSEIELTRKLYRNGESEYRINGSPARLKDIQEVFMDTGAGAKSYSIIAQGEINRLVQAKPEERRTMIEEVAGVTKFKLRKRESLRKIEQTELNLGRLQDLKVEIEKNLRSLQKQAEKAERARSLKEKVKRNDIIVNAHKVYDLLKGFRDSKTILNERTIELESWKAQKDELEIGLQEERFLKDDKTAKIEELQSEYNEISKGLAAAEERFNNLCQSLTQKESEIERRQKEVEDLQSDLEERTQRQESLLESLNSIEQESQEGEDFSALEEQVEALKEQLELKTSELQDLRTDASEKKEELQDLEQNIFRNSSKLEDYASQLEDMAQEIESLEKQYSGVSTELTSEREEVNRLEKELENLSTRENGFKAELEEKQKKYKELNKLATEKSRELIHKESKLSSLKEVNEAMEGAKEGAGEFLKSNDDGSYNFLGKFLKCAPEYTEAVQALLAPHTDALICLEQGKETRLWEWMNENSLPFDLLLTDTTDAVANEVKERLELKGFGAVTSLADIIELPQEVSESLRQKLKNFLSGFFIVENINSETIEKTGPGMSFYALADQSGTNIVRNSRAALTFSRSSDSEAQGVIARNNLIETLSSEISELKQEVTQLESDVEQTEANLESAKTEWDELRNTISDLRADFAAKKSTLDSKVKNLTTGSDRLEILKRRHSEISKSRLDLLEAEEKLSEQKIEIQGALEIISERLENSESECEDLKAQYEGERDELVQLQVNAKSYTQRLESAQSQVEDIEKQIQKINERITSQNELIENYREEIEKINEELEVLEAKNQETVSTLQDRESVLSDLKDDLAQILIGMQEREDEVKKLSSQTSKAEKEIIENESKLERFVDEEADLTRNIFEKYRIDLRMAIAAFLEMESEELTDLQSLDEMYIMETENGPIRIEAENYEFHRRYGQDLKDCELKLRNYKQEFNRLGEINWQAIEDYERQKLRYDFLHTQESELKQSLEDLRLAIDHIDEKSKERFKIAFDEVNQRFEKVFPIIFGGGNAALKVVGDINDAECGVDIIAQPPGKKMQNINLMSGGEKALTAVSLIFSIFLVKPSPFCLLDEVDAPLDDANVGRFNELLREMSHDSQFILITHNKKTMELNDTLYGVTMQEAGVSKAVSVQLH